MTKFQGISWKSWFQVWERSDAVSNRPGLPTRPRAHHSGAGWGRTAAGRGSARAAARRRRRGRLRPARSAALRRPARTRTGTRSAGHDTGRRAGRGRTRTRRCPCHTFKTETAETGHRLSTLAVTQQGGRASASPTQTSAMGLANPHALPACPTAGRQLSKCPSRILVLMKIMCIHTNTHTHTLLIRMRKLVQIFRN